MSIQKTGKLLFPAGGEGKGGSGNGSAADIDGNAIESGTAGAGTGKIVGFRRSKVAGVSAVVQRPGTAPIARSGAGIGI